MQRQFSRFVELPSRENYLAACRAVLRRAELPLVAIDLADLEQLLDAGEFQEVLDRIDSLPASKALSPRVHFFAAEAAEALGDLETGEVERFLFVLCLKGLLATGDGSQSAPYVVCHATDEHDVLEALAHEPAGQTLLADATQMLDMITCTDGRQVWFDVSAIFPRPARRVKPRANRRGIVRRVSRSPR
ncbi:MAG: hypothetical protein SFU86_09320 [Pirellulaceae bacterium]|nr:hypothetical protein [Pirellulaceae bacterium]